MRRHSARYEGHRRWACHSEQLAVCSEAVRQLRTATRRGLTLLEVVIALTIFFGALAALSQLAWNGSRAAVQARLKTQAIIRCETKLAEVLAGVETLQPKSKVSFPDDDKWTWTLNIAESNYPELLQIEVIAAHSGNNSLANVEFTLRRWMRDPGLFMDAAIQQKAEAEASSSGGTL